MPQFLIMDVSQGQEVFYRRTADLTRTDECSFEDMFAEVVLYVSDASILEMTLRALQTDLVDCHSRDGFTEDAEIIAKAGVELALFTIDQLKHLGVYDSTGILPYEVSTWISEGVVMLKKNLEFVI